MAEQYASYNTLFDKSLLDRANIVIVGLGPLAQHLGMVAAAFGVKNINYLGYEICRRRTPLIYWKDDNTLYNLQILVF